MLKDTILEIADEIADDMFTKYLGGSNDVRVPELKWVVYALHLENNTFSEKLIELMLKEAVTERYHDMTMEC